MAAAPSWAHRLIGLVAAENGRTVLPVLVWRRTRVDKQYSSGRTTNHHSPARIVVTAGTDEQDAKKVLLHELAHWLNPGYGYAETDCLAKAHDARFYETVRRLYRRFRLPVRECMADEAQRYPTTYAAWSNRRRRP